MRRDNAGSDASASAGSGGIPSPCAGHRAALRRNRREPALHARSAAGRAAREKEDGRGLREAQAGSCFTQSLTPELNLLRDQTGIVDIDAEIPDRTLDPRVAKQTLDGPEVARSPTDHRGLGAPQGMGAGGGDRAQSREARIQAGGHTDWHGPELKNGSFSARLAPLPSCRHGRTRHPLRASSVLASWPKAVSARSGIRHSPVPEMPSWRRRPATAPLPE